MSDPSAHVPIRREFIDDIKRRHPLHEVAALFTCLAPVGRSLAGRCPLHAETLPSFYVLRETQSWYCYGCQRGGDVIDLVRLRLDLPFDDALHWLDQRPTRSPHSDAADEACPARRRDPARTLAARRSAAGQAALATALAVYTQALWETPAAQHYLTYRGITEEVALNCQLGYCAGHQLRDALQARRIPLQAAWDVGLLVGTGRAPRERFAGRIVTPEVRGDTVAWMTGRLVEAAPGAQPAGPKYMSLPGARALGGAATLAGRSAVVAVEGAFDWLTLVKWGLPGCYLGGGGIPAEATAILGSVRAVYVAFDHDPAGQRMARSLARQLAGHVRFVDLPPGIKDVADLGCAPDGLECFRQCLRKAARHTCP